MASTGCACITARTFRASYPRCSSTYSRRSPRNASRARARGLVERHAGIAGRRGLERRADRGAHGRARSAPAGPPGCGARRGPAGAARRDRASRSAARPRRTSRPACRACRPATPPPTRRAPAPSCSRDGRRIGFDSRRQVVEVDGLPHRLGQPLGPRVDAAHRALQLGELAHHLGGEIGLREPSGKRRRRPRRPRVPSACAGHPARQPLQALGLGR